MEDGRRLTILGWELLLLASNVGRMYFLGTIPVASQC